MLTSVVGPLPVCRIMIVSVSSDVSLPVASSAFCSSVRLLRLSEPTISQLVPADVASPAGSGHPGQRGVDVHPERDHHSQQHQQDGADAEPARPHPRGRRAGRAGRSDLGRAAGGRWSGATLAGAQASAGMIVVSLGRGAAGRGGAGARPGQRGRRPGRPAPGAGGRGGGGPLPGGGGQDGGIGPRPEPGGRPPARRPQPWLSLICPTSSVAGAPYADSNVEAPTRAARTGFGAGGPGPGQDSSGSPSNRPSCSE